MATAGNLVWIDDNSDGLQQAENQRVANVLVEAFDSQNQKVGEDYTIKMVFIKLWNTWVNHLTTSNSIHQLDTDILL